MAFKIQTHTELAQVSVKENISLGIMNWGENNSYPQTLKNLVAQSPNAKPAVKRTSKFFRGQGFTEDDMIVNHMGMTLKELIAFCSDELALYEGFAIHCNYNKRYEVSEMIPIPLATLRFSTADETWYSNLIGFHSNFGRNAIVEKQVDKPVTKEQIKWLNRFNPSMVEGQIKKAKDGNIKNYRGQILYVSNTGVSTYPEPTLQSHINLVLADVENSILVRKESATGFINTYLLKTMMDNEDPSLIAMEAAMAAAQGARGSGKIITYAGLSQEEMNGTSLEQIASTTNGSGIIDSAQKTFNLCREGIIGAYLIPPMLAGVDQKTGLSSADLEDAYDVFNAITKDGRTIIESNINKILQNSAFKVKKIKLKPITLESDIEVEDNGAEQGTPEAPVQPVKKASETELKAQANLRGSVGGVQGILAIQESVASGNTTRPAAITTLIEIYGFDVTTADKLLGDPKTDEEKLIDETKIEKAAEESINPEEVASV